MKLLIDIPDWLYHHIVDFGFKESDEPELYWAIYKGKKIVAEDTLSEAEKEYIKRDEEALKDSLLN